MEFEARPIRRPRLPAPGDQVDDAGQDGLLAVAGLAEPHLLRLEGRAVGAGPEGAPGVEGVVGVADAAREERTVERNPVRRMDVAVGVDEGGLGVEDQPVEVEDECPDHGGVAARDFFVAPGARQA